jgi:hypothetical protein
MRRRLATVVVVVIVGLLAASCQAPRGPGLSGPVFTLQADGFVRNWLILAPIPVEDTALAVEQQLIPGEAGLQPRPGDKVTVSGKELVWKPLVTTETYFDINEHLGDFIEFAAGYAVAYVESPQDYADLTIGICSNDDGQLYLNGKQVYVYQGGRGLSEDADFIEHVALRKGVNVLVFKVVNQTNNWQGCLRFFEAQDKVLTNLKVRVGG